MTRRGREFPISAGFPLAIQDRCCFELRHEIRTETRPLPKNRRVDAHGASFQEKTYTENVSLSGFLSSCLTALRMDPPMEIYLMEPQEQYVRRARAVRSESSVAPSTRYGFRFMEKKGPWVLE